MVRGLRFGAAVALLVMFDCVPQVRTCDKGCINGSVCDTKNNVCVYPRADGGSAGGSTAGGAGGGGATASCVPACPASMECAGSVCAGRYSSLTLQAPARAGRPPVAIGADLALVPGRSRADPPVLLLALDGGVLRDDAGVAVAVLQLIDAGSYRAFGAFPPVDGPRQLFAFFPDAGLVATAVTTVDVTPPDPVIELSAPPARVSSTDGGLTTLDVAAPNAFRRDESVTVTIDSPETDLASVSVDLFSDGGGLQPVGMASGTCASRFDGGVCRQQVVDLWRHWMPSHCCRNGRPPVRSADSFPLPSTAVEPAQALPGPVYPACSMVFRLMGSWPPSLTPPALTSPRGGLCGGMTLETRATALPR